MDTQAQAQADLAAVTALLAKPEAWTQFTMARSPDRVVEPSDPDACRFCLMGAVVRTTGCAYSDRAVAVRSLIVGAAQARFPNRTQYIVPFFNDDPLTTHEDVLLVLKEAAGR